MAVLMGKPLVSELLPPGFVALDKPPKTKGTKRNRRRVAAHTYNRNVKYRPLYALQVRDLRGSGMTADEVAKAFGVVTETLYGWVQRYPAFRENWQLGLDIATGRVEESLYKRATGYEARREKVAFDKEGNVQRATYVEHMPADVGAIKYWLGNRAPERWRERASVEHSGPDGGPIELQARQAAISDLLAELRQAKRQALLAPDKAPEGSDLL